MERALIGAYTAAGLASAWLIAAVALDWPVRIVGAAVLAFLLCLAAIGHFREDVIAAKVHGRRPATVDSDDDWEKGVA